MVHYMGLVLAVSWFCIELSSTEHVSSHMLYELPVDIRRWKYVSYDTVVGDYQCIEGHAGVI